MSSSDSVHASGSIDLSGTGASAPVPELVSFGSSLALNGEGNTPEAQEG